MSTWRQMMLTALELSSPKLSRLNSNRKRQETFRKIQNSHFLAQLQKHRDTLIKTIGIWHCYEHIAWDSWINHRTNPVIWISKLQGLNLESFLSNCVHPNLTQRSTSHISCNILIPFIPPVKNVFFSFTFLTEKSFSCLLFHLPTPSVHILK